MGEGKQSIKNEGQEEQLREVKREIGKSRKQERALNQGSEKYKKLITKQDGKEIKNFEKKERIRRPQRRTRRRKKENKTGPYEQRKKNGRKEERKERREEGRNVMAARRKPNGGLGRRTA